MSRVKFGYLPLSLFHCEMKILHITAALDNMGCDLADMIC